MGVLALRAKRELDPGSDCYGNHSHLQGDLGFPTSKMSEAR